MSKKRHKDKRGQDAEPRNPVAEDGQKEASGMSQEDYSVQLRMLQIELVKMQRHFIGCGDRILVLLEGRDEMLLGTHTEIAPWTIVCANDKRLARLNLMRDILSPLHYAGKKNNLVQADRRIAFEFTPDCIQSLRLAR